MNVSKKTIYTELAAAEAATAAVAEGAVDLPQGTSCQRVISCDGRVTELAGESVKGALALEGLVEFNVVFEDAQGALDSVSGVCPFTHRLSAPQAEPGMEASMKCAVSSPSARAAGSGRLLVSAVVEIQAELTGTEPVDVVTAADDGRLETMSRKVFWHSRGASGKASVTVREEVEVPKDLPEVAKVLSARGDVRIGDVQALAGEAMVAGDLLFSVLYADKGGNVNRGSFSVPFGSPVQAGGMQEKMEAHAWGSASQLFINVGENLSDERRVLSVEAPLFLSVEGYEPCEMEALEDAYHLDCDIGMAREDIGLFDGPVEVSEKVKVKGALPRTDILDADSLLEAADVSALVDSWSVSEGSIDVSGRLMVRAFARSADGRLSSVPGETPYSVTVPWEGASPESKVNLSASVLACSGAAGQETVDVEAELELYITSRRLLEYRVITDIEQGQELRAMAPLTLCVAGAGDTAWSLARRCRVKVEDLIKTNPEIAGGVTPGAKLVILRK